MNRDQIGEYKANLIEKQQLLEKKNEIIEDLKEKSSSISHDAEKQATLGDLLDLVSKVMDRNRANPKKMIRVKNAVAVYAEQKLKTIV